VVELACEFSTVLRIYVGFRPNAPGLQPRKADGIDGNLCGRYGAIRVSFIRSAHSVPQGSLRQFVDLQRWPSVKRKGIRKPIEIFPSRIATYGSRDLVKRGFRDVSRAL